MINIFSVLFLQICVVNIYGQDTYKAAVVEYAPKLSADTPKNRVLENKEEFYNYIEDAAEKHVDIILFPEYGLIGMDINTHNIDEMSTEVPNPNLSISPCINPENYSKVLVDLSCAAKTHSMYVVINLSERVFQNDSKKNIYHNTNVVFNREGQVIGRFRKMNLYNESYVTAGNETVTFKTDFGVTFGVFICNDILFENSSLNLLLGDTVTDVLYSAAWTSELPFFGALTIQHSYAIANGVNLLTAGYDNPSSGLGGSGIYFANGSVADIYISGAKSSKMIIADVPKSHRRQSLDTCQNAVNMPERVGERFGIGGMMADINEFRTGKEDMSNYTFISLNLNQTRIYESVCDTKGLCCLVNITVSKTSVNTNHVYKLAVFDGGRYILTESIGVRVCSIVACQNLNSDSCGDRNYDEKPNGVIFDEILLKAIFNIKNAHYRPATLNYNLEPMNNYTFCRNVINKTSVEITILAKNQTNLLTFGIHGRVFENDNKGTGSFNSASFHFIYPSIMLIVSSIVFLL